jgi:hypothetical protein
VRAALDAEVPVWAGVQRKSARPWCFVAYAVKPQRSEAGLAVCPGLGTARDVTYQACCHLHELNHHEPEEPSLRVSDILSKKGLVTRPGKHVE